MNLFFSSEKLPAVILAGSFFTMLGLVLFTSPLKNLGVGMVFFLAFWSFIVTGGLRISRALSGIEGGYKRRVRWVVIGVFLTLLLMFRSAGALGPIDAVVMVIISVGALFYVSQRSE